MQRRILMALSHIGYRHPALYGRVYKLGMSILRAPLDVIEELSRVVLTASLIDDLVNLWITEAARNRYLRWMFANAPGSHPEIDNDDDASDE